MTTPVLSDAQISMVQVIRPNNGFEGVYQGKSGTVPIAMPGTLDPQAGQPGFAPTLLQGIPVPLGSRLLVQIPMTVDMYTSEPIYGYQFLWRTRNQQAFLDAIAAGREGGPYHLPSEEHGRSEVLLTDFRYFMPGSSDVEIFEQNEPVTDVPAVLNVRQQIYVPKLATSWVQPLTPAGAHGVWQQGTYQFSNNENCSGPTWFPLWLDAAGDELLILVYKIDTTAPWNFATTDLGFSNTYGTNNSGLPNNPNVGILLSSGTMGGG